MKSYYYYYASRFVIKEEKKERTNEQVKCKETLKILFIKLLKKKT